MWIRGAMIVLVAATAALAATECTTGQTLLVQGTDPKCVACPPGTYTDTVNNRGECKIQPQCGDGDSTGLGKTFVDSRIAKRTCTECPLGTFMVNSKHRRSECRPHTPCKDRKGNDGTLTKLIDTEDAPVPNPINDFTCDASDPTVLNPAGTDIRDCDHVDKNTDDATEFTSQKKIFNYGESVPRQCSMLETCQPGEYVGKLATHTSDRGCGTCNNELGQTYKNYAYSSVINAEKCTEIPNPEAGKIWDYSTFSATAPPTKVIQCPEGYKTGDYPYIECVAVATPPDNPSPNTGGSSGGGSSSGSSVPVAAIVAPIGGILALGGGYLVVKSSNTKKTQDSDSENLI